MSNKYQLIVRDMLEIEEEESYRIIREFDTLEAATEAAKDVIDEYLINDYAKNPNDGPLTLFGSFIDFGYMPYIIGPGELLARFNGRSYAAARCYELIGEAVPEYSVYGEKLEPTGNGRKANEE